MRIGIDFRWIAYPLILNRGMGRYSLQQLRQVLALDQADEIVLFCRPTDRIKLIGPDVLTAPNVRVAATLPGVQLYDESQNLRFSADYQRAVHAERVDLLHIPTPILLHEPALMNFNVCPLVATHYDLIPLLFPEQYLSDTYSNRQYHRSLMLLQGANRLIAISRHARDELTAQLKIAPDRIDVAYPIANPIFAPMTDDTVHEQLGALSKRLRRTLPARFILSVTATHYSKNLSQLLRAYQRLPAVVRQPLVLVSDLDAGQRDQIRRELADLNLTEAVILTGYVTDAELAALYNTAMVLVHPSRYEGFGMPVLEAMRCGCPVVASTAASLPEVVGNAGPLVDPDDTAALTDAIREMLEDSAKRAAAVDKSLQQAALFNGEQLGQQTFHAYHNTVHAQETEPRTLRIAHWTPIPPQRSGIADYSLELMDEWLADGIDVETFIDDDVLPDDDLVKRFCIQHQHAYAYRAALKPFDVSIYQIGSSRYHFTIYEQMLRVPGIAVIHDLALAGIFHAQFVSTWRDRQGWNTFLRLVEGEGAIDDYRAVTRHFGDDYRAAFDAFMAQHNLLRPIIEATGAQIVHTEAAASALTHRYSKAHPFVIHQGVRDPWLGRNSESREALRQRLQLGDQAFVGGVFGIVSPAKRIEAILEAAHVLQAERHDIIFVIVGEEVSSGYQQRLREVMEKLNLASVVRFTGYVDRALFDDFLIASDVVINLRDPAQMQMSATLARAISAGKPVLMSDLPEWRFLPDDFCLRIPLEAAAEQQMLVDSLRKLMASPENVEAKSRVARAWALENLTVRVMARRYIDVIERLGKPALKADPANLRYSLLPYQERYQRSHRIVRLLRDVGPHKLRRALMKLNLSVRRASKK